MKLWQALGLTLAMIASTILGGKIGADNRGHQECLYLGFERGGVAYCVMHLPNGTSATVPIEIARTGWKPAP